MRKVWVAATGDGAGIGWPRLFASKERADAYAALQYDCQVAEDVIIDDSEHTDNCPSVLSGNACACGAMP